MRKGGRREKKKRVVKGEERLQKKLKGRERSNWRGPHNRQDGRGHEVKTKGGETGTRQKSLMAHLACLHLCITLSRDLKGVQEQSSQKENVTQ